MIVKPKINDVFGKSTDFRIKEFLESLSRGDEKIELDAGIKDVVLFLVGCGFKPISSCEGGKGHQFELPRVVIKDNGHANVDRIAGALIGGGYAGFTVQHHQYFQANVERTKHIEHNFAIEFWVYEQREINEES